VVSLTDQNRVETFKGGEDITIEASLDSNPVEFDGFKIWVVEPFPDSEKLSVSVTSTSLPTEDTEKHGKCRLPLRLSTASPSIFNADSQAGGRDFGEPSLS
jgi:hypothetical protein